MNTRHEVLELIYNFTKSNHSELLEYSAQRKESKSKGETIEDNQKVSLLIDEVFKLMYGDKPENIRFSLKGHVSWLNDKTLSTVKKISDFNPRLNLNVDYLKKRLETQIIVTFSEMLCLMNANTTFEAVEKEVTFSMWDLRGDIFECAFKHFHCNNCDVQFQIDYDAKNKIFMPSEYVKEVCPCVSDVMNFTLNTPSKELVIINSLNGLLKVSRHDEFEISVNSIYGKIRECEEHLKHGIAYISLASGDVDIIQSTSEKMIVMDFDYDTYYEKVKGRVVCDNEKDWGDGYKLKMKEGFEQVDSVSLDLWGVYLLDKDLYEKLCVRKNLCPSTFLPVYVKLSGDHIDFSYDVPGLLIEGKY